MRSVWFFGIASAALFAAIAAYLAPLEPNILALQFAFTPRAFAQVVHAWPPEHLARYRAHLPWDFVLLGCYGAFGYLLASRSKLFRRYPRGVRRTLPWVMPLAAAFDAGENAFHGWLTELPRFGVAPAYAASALCSTLKWALLCAFTIAVVGTLLESRS